MTADLMPIAPKALTQHGRVTEGMSVTGLNGQRGTPTPSIWAGTSDEHPGGKSRRPSQCSYPPHAPFPLDVRGARFFAGQELRRS